MQSLNPDAVAFVPGFHFYSQVLNVEHVYCAAVATGVCSGHGALVSKLSQGMKSQEIFGFYFLC